MLLSYYYLSPRNAPGGRSSTLRQVLATTGIVIVGGAATLGFVMAGSPFSARPTRLDDRRVDDLTAIHHAIQKMTTARSQSGLKYVHPLPATLEEVAAFQRTQQSGRVLSLADPQTGMPYGYRTTGEKSYELIAMFTAKREKTFNLFWNHPAGEQRYSFDALSPP